MTDLQYQDVNVLILDVCNDAIVADAILPKWRKGAAKRSANRPWILKGRNAPFDKCGDTGAFLGAKGAKCL